MEISRCAHLPPCPSYDAPDSAAARLLVDRPEQGWCLLCNGLVVFDDLGVLLPEQRAMTTRR